MKTARQSLVAAALILAMATFGASSDALAGGGHHNRQVDGDHHRSHGKWLQSGQKKRAHASRGDWKRRDRSLTPRQRAQLNRWRHRVVREYAVERDRRLTRRQWTRIEQWRDRLDREFGGPHGRIRNPGHSPRHRHWHKKHRHGRHWNHKHSTRRHSGRSGQLPNFLNGGTVLGAIAGGVIGNQIGSGRGRVAATAGGALLGAIVGNEIYHGIQASDEARVARVLESTPSGQTVSWRNPDTGNSFKVTPSPAFKGANQRNCREYTTWAFLDGYEKELSGVACRDSRGRWQLMNG